MLGHIDVSAFRSLANKIPATMQMQIRGDFACRRMRFISNAAHLADSRLPTFYHYSFGRLKPYAPIVLPRYADELLRVLQFG